MQLVAVDIGGTHARFAIAEVEGDTVVGLGEPVTLKTADYASLQSAWRAFAAARPQPLPRAAAIAVACSIKGDALQLTNNPWVIQPASIATQMSVDTHILVNDFEAVGHAIARIDDSALRRICGPDVPIPLLGSITVVGPGTGLGVAQVVRRGGGYDVIACEGGHIDFAPLDAIDDAILADLRKRHRRVSVERVISGPGLAAIYRVIARIEGRSVVQRDDRHLWTAALDGTDSLAVAALNRFCMSLGAVAGDFALAHGPTAVVIAGGLGLRLVDHLPRFGFAERFIAKGRFQSLMETVPVKAIVHPQPGLFGAATAFAREHAQ